MFIKIGSYKGRLKWYYLRKYFGDDFLEDKFVFFYLIIYSIKKEIFDFFFDIYYEII